MQTSSRRFLDKQIPLILITALCLILSSRSIFAFLTDGSLHSPVNYLGFLPPAAGESYQDSVFGTTIRRISDALTTVNTGTGIGNLEFITHEYSTMSPFNNDDSKLLLEHQSRFALYSGSGNLIKELPFEIASFSEPRWSRRDTNVVYYIKDNQLKQYNAGNDSISVVHTFAEYTRISGQFESDICFDGDHFVLSGDNRDIFVYQISDGKKGAVLDTTGLGGFDSLYITPNDNVLVGWYAIGSGRYKGVELYDRDMNFLRQIARAIGHMDVTRDIDGQEVLLWDNAADPSPLEDCMNAIVKIRLSDGQQTCLLPLDESVAAHLSAPDRGGWCFASTHAYSDPLPDSPNWKAYTDEIVQIRLDRSQIRRLAHHRSRPFNNYNWQPRASVSRDGSRLIYSSNYGLQSILGSLSPNYSDVYLMKLRYATSIVFDRPSAAVGESFKATLSGADLTAEPYFDIRFRAPGNNTDDVVWNWQQGTSAEHPVWSGTMTGTWTVTGLRPHDDLNDHGGEFDPVSATLTVTSSP